MRAWIENADDIDQNILSIDVYEQERLISSTNWLYRPLTWRIEYDLGIHEYLGDDNGSTISNQP